MRMAADTEPSPRKKFLLEVLVHCSQVAPTFAYPLRHVLQSTPMDVLLHPYVVHVSSMSHFIKWSLVESSHSTLQNLLWREPVQDDCVDKVFGCLHMAPCGGMARNLQGAIVA